MDYPQELLDYWADLEENSRSEPSLESALRFKRHLNLIQPLAEAGNFDAKYAMATIYHLGLNHPNQSECEMNRISDQQTMTALLFECAMDGMVSAFDNLVASGVGEAGESARTAANEYELQCEPAWDAETDLPIYCPNWMAGAMNLWLSGAEK